MSLSEYDRAVAHATRSAEGSQGCRKDADDDLQDGLPSFFLHSAFKFKLDMLMNSPEALCHPEPPLLSSLHALL